MMENDAQFSPMTTSQKAVTLAGVLVPFIGLVVAIFSLWGWGLTLVDLALLLSMYTATGLGITVGYHRLFAHRSFKTSPFVRFVLAVLGSMAAQAPVIQWVAIHRQHHQYSDESGDPHSPHRYGGGVRGIAAGFWHAHIGWFFNVDYPSVRRYVNDLRSDRLLSAASRLFEVWVLLGLLLPAAIGWALNGGWSGALLGFLWGGLVRIFLLHHVTWSINSVCHLWGSRPFDQGDQSRNNVIFGVLGFGEGWHNNHHAFPASARHGLSWWQLDLSYLVIRGLEFVGLARRVRVRTADGTVAKRPGRATTERT